MKTMSRAAAIAAALAMTATTLGSAAAQDAKQKAAPAAADRVVEQYTCKEIMRESGPNREVAIAFLHGFLLGKSGSSKFNVDLLYAQGRRFVDYCLDNPREKAVDALAKFRG